MFQKIKSFPLILNFVIFSLALTLGAGAVGVDPLANPENLKKDVYFLADESLEGRLAGSEGCRKAADYIKSQFSSIGLLPGDSDGDFFQDFEIFSDVSLSQNNRLEINNNGSVSSYEPGPLYTPLYFSANGEIEGDVVFAGYGITAPELGWDDYEDIDANGKIVLCMRGEPAQDDPQSPFNGDKATVYSDLHWKAFNAVNHGAIALILVTGPNHITTEKPDKLIPLTAELVFAKASIPVIQISQSVLADIWAGNSAPLEMYQAEIDRHKMAFGMAIDNVEIKLNVNLERKSALTSNVIGILPGSDPSVKDQFVIIGAHYDHIGLGKSSMINQGNPGVIHPGADDNASGVAGVIELARLLSKPSVKPRRSILFICFSAEEMGLIGSRFWVSNPTVPLDKISAMLNFDMIGRVQPDNSGQKLVTIQGSYSSDDWPSIIPQFSPDGSVKILEAPNTIGGSDFTSFYNENIPILNFFSGAHEDYNKPTDTADRINYIDQAKVIDAAFVIVKQVANRRDKLTFSSSTEVKQAQTPSGESGSTRSVYLGTIPDYMSSGDGFKIMGVQPGSPAEAAGLKGGDQIIRLGDYEITDIYSYSFALSEYAPGDTVTIVVIRGDEELSFTVTFAAKN